MPFITLNDAEIHYEMSGSSGPWVVLLAAARLGMADMEVLRQAFLAKGFRVLSHDRRNCGLSSLDLDNPMAEEAFWQDDLLLLLNKLKIRRAFFVGHSRSNRVILRFALAHPSRTIGLGLWGLTGGAKSVRFLCSHYYQKYISAAETGGMQSVCERDHFKQLISVRPDTYEKLMALDAHNFALVMERWKKQFLEGAGHPVFGIADDEFRAINVPVAIIPIYDWLHPIDVSLHASKMLTQSYIFNYDADREGSAGSSIEDNEVAQILCQFASNLTVPFSTRISKWWWQCVRGCKRIRQV